MKSISLAVVGFGDLGRRCAAELPADYQVTGLCRRPERLPPGIIGQRADYTVPGDLAGLASLEPQILLLTLKPAAMSPEGYRAGFVDAAREVVTGLGGHCPRRIIMVSSTRVYAESEGGWVEEDSPVDGSGYAAGAILEAENVLSRAGQGFTAVRCAGIYGDASGRLLSRIRRGAIAGAEPVRYTNRIHRDDAGAFLAHLVQHAGAGGVLKPVYIGVDDAPAPRHEVETWLADRLGVEESARHPVPAGDGGHKRCRNRLLRDSGYRLRHADYKSGYEAALQAEPAVTKVPG